MLGFILAIYSGINRFYISIFEVNLLMVEEEKNRYLILVEEEFKDCLGAF